MQEAMTDEALEWHGYSWNDDVIALVAEVRRLRGICTRLVAVKDARDHHHETLRVVEAELGKVCEPGDAAFCVDKISVMLAAREPWLTGPDTTPSDAETPR